MAASPLGRAKHLRISRPGDRRTALLAMHSGRVNALTREFCDDMRLAIQALEADDTCHALILTSDLPNVFCAGMDLHQMIQPRVAEFIPFWSSFLRLFVTLFNTRLATVAAINGHAIAGGTALALACDHRIMLEGPSNNPKESKESGKPSGKSPAAVYQLGLNEVAIGIPVPNWLCQALTRVVGPLQAERLASSGRLLDAHTGLRVGLLDEVVEARASQEQFLARAQALVQPYLGVPSQISRALVKGHFRRQLSNSLLGNLDEIATTMFDTLQLATIQAALRASVKVKVAKARL